MNHDAPERVMEDGLHVHDPKPYLTTDPSKHHAYEGIIAVESAGKQEETLGGLRPRTFWFLIAAIGLIVIAAAVGGAVGGTRAAQKEAASIPAVGNTATSRSAQLRYISCRLANQI
jgi:hypothetical protein